jgi:hypothetical protein
VQNIIRLNEQVYVGGLLSLFFAVPSGIDKTIRFLFRLPCIRHAGNPAGVRRELNARDVTLASLLLLRFSGYLSQKIDEQVILGI